MRTTRAVAVCLACAACYAGTIGSSQMTGAGADAASVGGDAGLLPGADAAGPGGDAAIPGDGTASGDAAPALPTVTLRDQLLGAAAVVLPWGSGGVAALGGAVVRFDGVGAVTGRLALGPVIADLAADPAAGRIVAALGDKGAVVIDASGGTLIETARLLTRARGVHLSGSRLFVVPAAGGAAIYDLATTQSVPTATVTFDGPSTDVTVFESAAYVAQSDGRLAVLPLDTAGDFAGPAAFLSLRGPPVRLHVEPAARALYAACGLDGVAVIDINDASLVPGSTPTYFGSSALAVTGSTRLFVAGGVVGVQEWNPADTSAPVATVPAFKARDVALAGSRLLLADDNRGVFAIDASGAPGTPSALVAGGAVGDMELRGGTALVATGYGGVGVVDVGNGTVLAVHDVNGTVLRLADSGSVLAGIDDRWNLLSIALPDVTQPPASVASFDLGYRPVAVEIVGDVALVAHQDRLASVDLSTPSAPLALGSVGVEGERLDLARAGTLLLAAGASPPLVIFDVSNPASPSELGRYIGAERFDAVAVAGARLVLLDAVAGLSLIDITDPAAPVLVHAVALGGLGRRVSVAGDLVWVADAQGLLLVRLGPSGFGAPARVASFGFTEAVLFDGVRGLAAGAQAGVRVIEIE